MLAGPAINTSVTLDVVGWSSPRRTRVEDLDDEIVVAAPIGAATDHEPSLGSSLGLSWQGCSGPMAVQVTLVAKELRRVATWRLQPEGNVVINQRRQYVRAGTLVPMSLHTVDGSLGGHLLDVSEGGLLFVTRSDRSLDLEGRSEAVFTLVGNDFRVFCEVVRIDRDDARLFAAFRFTDLSPAHGDRIRRAVFALQARDRVRF